MTELEDTDERLPEVTDGGRSLHAAPTIYDIAELAGVNPSTVSRALSKPGRISAKTEERIRQAAKQLNYHVNPMARALPTGRTRTLGLIVADITNPMFFDVMRGAERAAARRGYTLVLAESQESGERESKAVGRVAPAVDGLILATTRMADDRIRALASTKPLVVINRWVDGAAAIVPDLTTGIQQALDHLAALGHRSIAYISGPSRSWMSSARWEELMERSVALGMTIVEIGPNPPTIEGGREALPRVRAAGVSAVVAYNDLIAIGLLHTAQEQGMTVPGSLSIVGFDNIFGSTFTSPPLTTIAIPFDREGELAVTAVLDGLDHGDMAAAVHQWGREQENELATTLIVRGSTGRPT